LQSRDKNRHPAPLWARGAVLQNLFVNLLRGIFSDRRDVARRRICSLSRKVLPILRSGEFLHQWRIFAPFIILTTQNPFEVRLAIEVGCVGAFEVLRDTWGKQTATVDKLYHFAEV
jgi:hypothetical protein